MLPEAEGPHLKGEIGGKLPPLPVASPLLQQVKRLALPAACTCRGASSHEPISLHLHWNQSISLTVKFADQIKKVLVAQGQATWDTPERPRHHKGNSAFGMQQQRKWQGPHGATKLEAALHQKHLQSIRTEHGIRRNMSFCSRSHLESYGPQNIADVASLPP